MIAFYFVFSPLAFFIFLFTALIKTNICLQVVITKGYRVRATMFRSQNAFAPTL